MMSSEDSSGSGSTSSSRESPSDSFTNVLTLGSEGTIKNTTRTIDATSDSFTATWTTDPSGTIVATEVTIDPGSGSGSGSGNESVALGAFAAAFIEGGMEGVPPAGWQVESSTTEEDVK